MPISHTRETKIFLTQGGIQVGTVLSILAAGAGYVALGGWAIVFTGLAIACFGISFYGFIAHEDVKRVRRLSIRNASIDDLDRFHARLGEFTNLLIPLSERHRIYNRNPGCFRVIEDIRDDNWRKSLDILAIYPVNLQTINDIGKGLIKGADIRSHHIMKSFKVASGLYVSFAEGNSVRTRAFIIEEIERIIKDIKLRPILVATTPTTKEALTLVVNKSFRSLSGGIPVIGKVCILEILHQG